MKKDIRSMAEIGGRYHEKSLKRRLICILLTLTMIFQVMPVSATEATEENQETFTSVTSAEELREAISKGESKLRMDADISVNLDWASSSDPVESSIDFPAGKSFELDMNGHTITEGHTYRSVRGQKAEEPDDPVKAGHTFLVWYYGENEFKFTEAVERVTVNGEAAEPDAEGKYLLKPQKGEQIVVVKDQAGNSTAITVTVNDGHTGGRATCTEKAVCEHCGEAYGEVDKTNHTGEAEWTRTETTHEKKYSCCGAVVVREEDHEW